MNKNEEDLIKFFDEPINGKNIRKPNNLNTTASNKAVSNKNVINGFQKVLNLFEVK